MDALRVQLGLGVLQGVMGNTGDTTSDCVEKRTLRSHKHFDECHLSPNSAQATAVSETQRASGGLLRFNASRMCCDEVAYWRALEQGTTTRSSRKTSLRCVRPRRALQRIMAIGKGWTGKIPIGIYSKETFVDKLTKIEVRRLLSKPYPKQPRLFPSHLFNHKSEVIVSIHLH